MQDPLVFLSRWQIMETDDECRHFIGYNVETGTGRASTAIVSFDPQTHRGVTQSGRIYELVAGSGIDGNANVLWDAICAQSGTSSRDVSSEYDQASLVSHKPVAPLVAILSSREMTGTLSASIPASRRMFEADDPAHLAELLFSAGVRQGYLRFADSGGVENQTSFVNLLRVVERRLNQLERDCFHDGDHSSIPDS